jgi:uncharacterized membrane protein
MTRTRPRAVGEYLRQLERSLKDLPTDRRNEIVAEIEEHIDGRLAELGEEPGEAGIRNVLERLGDPADIADEARDRFAITPVRARWTDTAAVIALPIPFIGWLVGSALVWMSQVWTTREKLIGTGAIAVTLLLGLVTTVASSGGADESTAVPTGPGQDPAGLIPEATDSGLGILEIVFIASWLLIPLLAAIYLGMKLRRAR